MNNLKYVPLNIHTFSFTSTYNVLVIKSYTVINFVIITSYYKPLKLDLLLSHLTLRIWVEFFLLYWVNIIRAHVSMFYNFFHLQA